MNYSAYQFQHLHIILHITACYFAYYIAYYIAYYVVYYSAYSAYCYMQNMQNMHINMQKYVNEYAVI